MFDSMLTYHIHTSPIARSVSYFSFFFNKFFYFQVTFEMRALQVKLINTFLFRTLEEKKNKISYLFLGCFVFFLSFSFHVVLFCYFHVCFYLACCVRCISTVLFVFWWCNLTLTHHNVRSVREQCKVIYSYKPANEDELELKEGDLITILTKDLPDKGWWKGELKGKIGVFPDNFVQVISSDGKHFSICYFISM